MNIKSFLKQIPVVYEVNAYLKARRMSREWERLKRHYSRMAEENDVTYSTSWALRKVKQKLNLRGLVPRDRSRGDLRIFWVGTDWNQDHMGLLQALEIFGEVIVFHDANGDYGLLGPGKKKPKNLTYAELNSHCLLDQIEAALENGKIDVLIGQMWAQRISADVLKQIQELGIITINVSLDDKIPYLWDRNDPESSRGAVGLCAGVDLTLTTTPDCCLWYAVEDCPALFWPMASDPDVFRPYETKEYDVSFAGKRYGVRGKVVDRLTRAGVEIEAFGSGWPNGRIGPRDMAEVYGKSKIVLGVGTVSYSESILTLKLRDFNAPMAGALYVTHRNPVLSELYSEGEEIVCYTSIGECVNKISYYLEHPNERKAVANGGLMRARQDHTWEQRFANALEAIGLVPVKTD